MNLIFKIIFSILIVILVSSCNQFDNNSVDINANNNVSLFILGNVQDAGSPHIGCKKNCCKNLFEQHDNSRMVVSLGLIDFENQKKYLFEATPNLPEQLNTLSKLSNNDSTTIPNGIFLTHAHIGHYTGLMYLGKEGLNS
jgi:pyrroloquinoline quinone biosynthesis protein B